jgi:hypothetical protein
MPRETIDYQRRSSVKSPAIFYVAVEGEKTEVHYFNELNRKIQDSRFQVKVVSRGDPSFSAPRHVLDSILQHAKAAKADDRLWIVIDRDKWPANQLDSVASISGENGVEVAFSNPCFELWMLLHHRKIKDLAEIKSLNARRKVKDKMVSELRSIIGTYNQNAPDMDIFFAATDVAVENAKQITPTGRVWFDEVGSTMHELISSLRIKFK